MMRRRSSVLKRCLRRDQCARTLISIMRSISSSVVSSNVSEWLCRMFTSTSSPPNAATVFSTAPLMASASAASAWIAIAFPPALQWLHHRCRRVRTLEYVIARLAPSAARRFAIAAPCRASRP